MGTLLDLRSPRLRTDLNRPSSKLDGMGILLPQLMEDIGSFELTKPLIPRKLLELGEELLTLLGNN